MRFRQICSFAAILVQRHEILILYPKLETNMNRRTILLASVALLGFALPASANDAALYDAPPPPNSAFVRLIDARGTTGLEASLGEKAVTLSQSAVSGYTIAPAGILNVVAGDVGGEVTIEAGKFYTIALFANGSPAPLLLEDKVIGNPAKSGVYLYNFSAEHATLFAPKQKVAVIENIAAASSGFREINAVTLDLDIKAGAVATSLKDIALKRREGTSIVLFSDGKVAAAANAVLP
jgi:Alginate O-acetyl transferase AlgF